MNLEISPPQSVHLPNSRLLYQEFYEINAQWHHILSVIDSFIQSQENLYLANNGLYFYFFCPPDDPEFQGGDHWVGREIVGYPDIELNEDFQVYDLDHCDAWQVQIDLCELSWFSQKSLEELYQKAIKYLQNNDVQYAKTWRMVMDLNQDQEDGWRLQAQLQFFEGSLGP